MNIEGILAGIIVLIIIGVWLNHSGKLGRQLKNTFIIVVDSLALLMLCVANVGFIDKILTIIVLLVAGFFWIIWENREKKEISLSDIKKSHLDDMCFCMGIVIIIFFFVRMLFGKGDF